MKKIYKLLKYLIIISSITAIIGIIIAYNIIFKHFVLFSAYSPNNKYCVTLEYEEPFLYAPHNIYIYSNEKGDFFRKKIFKGELQNDGVILDSSNYSIRWNDSVATLILYGEEQDPQQFAINCYSKIFSNNFLCK